MEWTLVLDAGYGPKVPESVRSENARLKALLTKYCRGPYDESRVEFDIGLIVEGEIGSPNPQAGIKVGPFANNTIFAEIYVGKVDWEVPPTSYRQFVWLNVDQAILACVEKLKRKHISVDVDKLCQHLSLAGAKFLGENAKSMKCDLASTSEAVPVGGDEEDLEQRVVIQYQRDDKNAPWDFGRKIAFENLLNDTLMLGDLGFCDCVDFDTGTVNAICSVSNAEKATKAIIKTLRINGRLNGAVIEETVKGRRKVVWPEGYVGGIEYI